MVVDSPLVPERPVGDLSRKQLLHGPSSTPCVRQFTRLAIESPSRVLSSSIAAAATPCSHSLRKRVVFVVLVLALGLLG